MSARANSAPAHGRISCEHSLSIRAFLADLQRDIDPCDETDEFHTFVFDGPIFARPITVARGVTDERDGFVFCDLVSQPAGAGMHRNGFTTGGFR